MIIFHNHSIYFFYMTFKQWSMINISRYILSFHWVGPEALGQHPLGQRPEPHNGLEASGQRAYWYSFKTKKPFFTLGQSWFYGGFWLNILVFGVLEIYWEHSQDIRLVTLKQLLTSSNWDEKTKKKDLDSFQQICSSHSPTTLVWWLVHLVRTG